MYIILITIFLDEFDKRFSELACLTHTNTLDLLQLLNSNGEISRHLGKRYILEHHPWGKFVLAGHIAPQALQLSEESLIKCTHALVAFLYSSTFLLMLVFSAIVALPYAPLANEDGTIVPVSMIASSYAVINIMAFLGAIIGNTVVAGIADAMGFSVGFAALAIPFLLSGLALFLLPKTK